MVDLNQEIFQYSDYREFLKFYYTHQKKNLPGFTYEVLAQRGGFSSASFPKLVAEGKRNLTKESGRKMAKALRLNKESTHYFEELVAFTQAVTLDEKTKHLLQMDRFRNGRDSDTPLLREYRYLKDWYHCVIRELVAFPGFVEDANWIREKLLHRVKLEDIEASLKFLEESGFLTRNRKGKLIKKDKTLATGKVPAEVELSAIVRTHHVRLIELAKEAAANLPKEKRYITNTTVGLSSQKYEAITRRIQQFQFELLEMARSDDGEAAGVYNINLNVFPLTNTKSNAAGGTNRESGNA